jgi:hypothetical protein
MKYKNLVGNVKKTDYKNGYEYFEAIERLTEAREDLNKISDTQHLLGIVKPFLIKWGRMGRVVGREELNWEKFGEILRSLEKEFEELRRKKFINVDYDETTVSTTIKTIYCKLDTLPYLGGPTTISKLLHLLNPEIFVMWDIGIRKWYKKRNNRIRSNSEGYLEFLKETQKEIQEALNDRHKETGKGLDKIEEDIRKKYDNITLAKIIDEYNYRIVHS